jgi:hypothetical protein
MADEASWRYRPAHEAIDPLELLQRTAEREDANHASSTRGRRSRARLGTRQRVPSMHSSVIRSLPESVCRPERGRSAFLSRHRAAISRVGSQRDRRRSPTDMSRSSMTADYLGDLRIALLTEAQDAALPSHAPTHPPAGTADGVAGGANSLPRAHTHCRNPALGWLRSRPDMPSDVANTRVADGPTG